MSEIVLTDRTNKRPASTILEGTAKRNAACVVTESTHPVSEFGLQEKGASTIADAAFWREKYEALERDNNEYLKDMEDQTAISKEKERNLVEYVKILEQKVQLMSEKPGAKAAVAAAEVNTAVAAETPIVSAPSAPGAVCIVDTESAKLKDQLKCFKLLTNMSVEATEGGEECTCTVRNRARKRLVKFSIGPSGEAGGCEFKPVANAHVLPEYLQSVVAFEPTLAPALLADVLSALYSEE